MPRNVRNFWVELDVDGRTSRIAAGPVRKDGGFALVVKMRDKGSIVKALRVNGFASGDDLRLEAFVQEQTHNPIEVRTVR